MEIAPLADYRETNRKLWNERTSIHVSSKFYDVPGFLENPFSLKEIEIELLGNIRGKTALHLQCHFGQDTISLATLGAKAIGLDFSETAIAEARRLTAATGADASFVCADVYAAREVLRDEQYDLVFSSYGAIGWLPDMPKWARIVADSLRPGGRFIFAEFHPMVWAFSDDFATIQYSYFNRGPNVETESGTYTDPHAPICSPAVSWNHSLKDVLGALLNAGLHLKRFEEYDYSPYNCFQKTVETSPGHYMIRGLEGKLPMVYALEAVKL